MGIDDCERTLLAILRGHSHAAVAALLAIDGCLPEKARGIRIIVHLSQDADGIFGVMVHLDGPDSYAVNKVIGDFRPLFDVRFVDVKITPDVPQFRLFQEPFSVNDAIVDIAMVWLNDVRAEVGGMRRRLPVTVEGEDGHGSRPVVMSLAA